jgi:hypothetical protein
MHRNRRWLRTTVAALAATALVSPLAAGAAQANEPPLWATEVAKIPSTEYTRDALHYMTEGTEALRPWVDEEGLDASRLEPVLDDVANAYYDGARFKGRTEADVAFDNLTKFESFLKSRMTGASPPNGDAEVGHVDALVKSMTGVRLLADAAIQDANATVGPFRSQDLPDDVEIPAGMDEALALLDAAEAELAKTDEFFLKANVEPATINASRAWSNGFAVLETFGITYEGDHDDDGVQDVLELMLGSSPLLADSDFDGLTDRFEITELVGWTWPANPDSDADGTDDGHEDVDGDGLNNLQEQELGTSPTNPDTDGDGATDGEEVAEGTNPLVPDQPVQPPLPPDEDLPPIETQPVEGDADGDGIGDIEEAEESATNPQSADSDGDGLSDAEELNVGTDPNSSDGDGDGFTDPYELQHEDDQGLNPNVFDERVSTWDYVTDFAIGFVAGELWPKDSLAWLAGNICSGGLSFIPVYGWIAGAITDTRDAIGAAIQGDWVGAGMSLLGIIPYAGDAVSIPAKVAKWAGVSSFASTTIQPLAATPAALRRAITMIVREDVLAGSVKLDVLRLLIGDAVDTLRSRLGDDALLILARNPDMDLGLLARALSSPMNRSVDEIAPWIRAGNGKLANKNGEDWVHQQLGGNHLTEHTIEIDGLPNRRMDVAVDRGDGTYDTHEVKTGDTTYRSEHVVSQCERDGKLKRDGKIVDVLWHFLPASNALDVGVTDRKFLGIPEEVLNCLEREGIPFKLYAPQLNTGHP